MKSLGRFSAVLLSACATDLRPLPDNFVTPRTLVVERGYTRHRIATTYFPAGRYAAQFVDSGGTYYASPTKVVSTVYGIVDGGFYVPFTQPSQISPYLIDDDYENDSHQPVKLANGIPNLSFHFER